MSSNPDPMATTAPEDAVGILQSGITSILDAINHLIPAWSATTANLDVTAQSMNQLAIATAQSVDATANNVATITNLPQPSINVAVNPRTIPLPNEFKGTKDKASYFLRACNQYFVQAEVLSDGVKIATALALMSGDRASKWAENQLKLIQDEKEGALTTWASFQTAFKDHFSDRTLQETTAIKI
ncbi:hypothetical protein C0993_010295 [Termitomyces sp. T159_Od127]|nr:hypothetical protein C0993_010295 [Termitomyces sp. T159_Od127]